MMDINMIIASNILGILKKQGKKQIDLADGIGVSKQTVSKMLNGDRTINAVELKKIADYLKVSMESIMQMPENDVIHTLMGRVETKEAREALKVADEVSDMILFHSRVRRNGTAMMQPWEP